MKPSDEELMLSIKCGEDGSFEVLTQRHYSNTLNFIYRLVGNRDLAEDLCQDTFIRLWRSAPNYRPLAKFTTFLYCIAKNVCLKELAKAHKAPFISSLDEPLFEDGVEDLYTLAEEVEDDRYIPEDGVLKKELSRQIQAAISSLSADHRLVFILTEYHGMSYQEVADIVQCPVGTVASRKNAAVRRLRKTLNQYI